jgi:hypothetical protein
MSGKPHYKRFIDNLKMGADDECWFYGKNQHYARIREAGAGSRQWLAHRYAYWIFNGRLPDDKVIMHTCDNPRCVNPYHLVAGSQRENIADASAKGRLRGNFKTGDDPRRRKGSAHPISKLVESDIPIIRADTRPTRLVSEEYGVSRDLIRAIKRRKAWRHVE